MTEQQLATELKELVRDPDVPQRLDVARGIADGRRALRRRRLGVSVGAALGVCALSPAVPWRCYRPTRHRATADSPPSCGATRPGAPPAWHRRSSTRSSDRWSSVTCPTAWVIASLPDHAGGPDLGALGARLPITSRPLKSPGCDPHCPPAGLRGRMQ